MYLTNMAARDWVCISLWSSNAENLEVSYIVNLKVDCIFDYVYATCRWLLLSLPALNQIIQEWLY